MKKEEEAPCIQEASSPLGGADVFVMRGSEHTPLYQRVALWGWCLGRPFSRHDVAKTFGINLDSAGNVMSYLRRARPDVVKSLQWYERGARGARKRYMQILSAPNVDGKPVRMMPVHLLGGKKEGSLQDMRRRFIRGTAAGLGRAECRSVHEESLLAWSACVLIQTFFRKRQWPCIERCRAVNGDYRGVNHLSH